MFDPELWKHTKTSTVSLLILGAVLLLPASFVFLLAILLMDAGDMSMIRNTADAALFWSALVGSSVGGLAWMSLCLLVFQRRDIRVHRLAWHLVRLSGVVITACLGIWIWLVSQGETLHLSPDDGLVFLLVLCAILAVALLLVWLGHQNLGLVKTAARLAEAAKTAESERFSDSTP